VTTSSSSIAPKLKKAKDLTHRPKPRSLERTTTLLDTEKMEIVEHVEAFPLASETIFAMEVKASVDLVEQTEAKSSKVEEHPKLLSP
jgi:hypothetical protein